MTTQHEGGRKLSLGNTTAKRTNSEMSTSKRKTFPSQMYQVVPIPSQQQLDLEPASLLVIAKKQVVVNVRSKRANWQRKSNTISKNQIKRQTTMLSSLPMIPMADSSGEGRVLNHASQLTPNDGQQQQTLSPKTHVAYHANNEIEIVSGNTQIESHNRHIQSPLVQIIAPMSPDFSTMQQKYEDNLIARHSKRDESHGITADLGQHEMFDSKFATGSNHANFANVSQWDYNSIQFDAKTLKANQFSSQIVIKGGNYGSINQQQYDSKRTKTSYGANNAAQYNPFNIQGSQNMVQFTKEVNQPKKAALNKTTIFQEWGHGKPTSTSFMQNIDQQNQVKKYFDKRTQSKSVTGQLNLIASSKRRYKSQQRQLKGLINLGDIKSSHINGIKISRLNDLAQREDGNPLAEQNRLKVLQLQKQSTQPLGGIQTQILAHFNAEAKVQFEAIQDFACKESLYNKTMGAGLRMSLKKLIGRQAILMPEKLPIQDTQVAVSPKKHIKTHKRSGMTQEPPTDESRKNQNQLSVSMMCKLLNDSKFGGKHSQHVYVQSEELEANDDTEELESPREVESERNLSEKEKLKINPGVSLIAEENQLTPSVLKKMLHTKTTTKNRFNSVASWKGESKGTVRSRTSHQANANLSFRSQTNNKDMQEMLEQNDKIVSAQHEVNKKSKIPISNEMQQQKMHIAQQNLQGTSVSIKENSQNKIETSEDNASMNALSSALYPIGAIDFPYTPHEDAISKSAFCAKQDAQGGDGGDAYFIALLSSDEKSQVTKKQQIVYSHQEKTNAAMKTSPSYKAKARKGIEVFEERDRPSLPLNKKTEVAQNTSNQSSQEKMGYGNLTPQLIGVTSVTIQNIKQREEANNKTRDLLIKNIPPVNIKRQEQRKQSAVDHDLELGEIGSGSAYTMVRKSYRESRDLVDTEFMNRKMRLSEKSSEKQNLGGAHGRSYQDMLYQNIAIISGGSGTNVSRVIIDDPGTLANSTIPEKDHHQKSQKSMQSDQRSSKNVFKGITRKFDQMGRLFDDSLQPSMLNIISKKTRVIQPQKNKSRSGERTLMNTITQKTDSIIEQMNAINNMVSNQPSTTLKETSTQAKYSIGAIQPSGYHMLEPKLFSTNTKVLEKARFVRSGVSSEKSAKESDAPSFTKKRLISQRTSLNDDKNLKEQSPDQKECSVNQEEEMGYVRHKAIDNRLKGHRLSIQRCEVQKREQAKRKTSQIHSMDETQMRLQSRQQQDLSQQLQFNSITGVTEVLMSTQKSKMQATAMMKGPFSMQKQKNVIEDSSSVPFVEEELRKINSIEKTVSGCINIEKVMRKPMKQIYSTLDSMIGCQDITIDKSFDSIVSGDVTPPVSPQKMRGKGLMRLNSLQISELYKDHFKYEFPNNELCKILGELDKHSHINATGAQKRYFLKFTSMQIVNIDCQNGLISDGEPLSIPMSKMIKLFFLSQEQLQQVLGQSLGLRKEGGKIKLYINKELLRTNTYKTLPHAIRDDFFSAPLKVNIIERIEDHLMIKDSFNVEIRMPCFEILSSTSEINKQSSSQSVLYKTTMTHSITGFQMLELLQKYGLIDWVKFTKRLIKKHIFGLDQWQADGNSAMIKFQRLNNKNEFVFYQDPIHVAQEELTARNRQLILLIQENFTLQIEFLQPFFVKLKLAEEEIQDPDPEHEHLPGYLSAEMKKKAKTIARVQIPFERLSWIKQTFGDRISRGDGCFTECLFNTIDVILDTQNSICRLTTPNWNFLEELNLRQLSYQYFLDQQNASKTQQDNLKYLHKTVAGGVKQMFEASQKLSTTTTTKKALIDLGQSIFKEPTKTGQQIAQKMLLPLQTELNHLSSFEKNDKAKKPKFLILNDQIKCTLKLSHLTKIVIWQDIHQELGKDGHELAYSPVNISNDKVALEEFFRQSN